MDHHSLGAMDQHHSLKFTAMSEVIDVSFLFLFPYLIPILLAKVLLVSYFVFFLFLTRKHIRMPQTMR